MSNVPKGQRKMGRPKTNAPDSTVISIRLPNKVIEVVDVVAGKECRSRNNTIMWLLGMGIGSYEVGRVTELVSKP